MVTEGEGNWAQGLRPRLGGGGGGGGSTDTCEGQESGELPAQAMGPHPLDAEVPTAEGEAGREIWALLDNVCGEDREAGNAGE